MPQDKKQIAESDIVKYFNYIWNEANSYFESYVKKEWDENYKLYTDSYAYPDKMSWQSKIKDPITDNLVTRLSNYLTRILISTDDKYFTVDHPDPARSDAYKELISSGLRDNEYPLIFSDSIKDALLTAPYCNKVEYCYSIESYPVQNRDKRGVVTYTTTEEVLGRVKIIPLSPYNIRLDPKGDAYIIETAEYDIAEYRRMAQANKWRNTDKVISNTAIIDPKSTRGTDGFRPRVRLYYIYTRALTDGTGKILDTDCCFIIANGKYVVDYDKNLLPRGRFPYVIGFPLKAVVGRYGRGYVSKLRSTILAYLDSLNLILDGFTLSVLGIFEYDVEAVVNDHQHQFTAALYPGKFYAKRGSGQALSQIFNPNVPAVALQLLYYLDKILQNRSFQNEFFMGSPTVKGRPTASEVSIKTQESGNFITDIGSEIERSIITPLIELVLMTELIYLDDNQHVDLKRNIRNESSLSVLNGLGFNARIEDLKSLTIEVKGISGKIQKMGNYNKVIQILNVLGNMPQVIAALRVDKLVTSLFESFDDSPEELFDMKILQQIAEIGATQSAPTGIAQQASVNPTSNIGG